MLKKKKKTSLLLTSCCDDEQHIQSSASVRSMGQLRPPEEVLVRRLRCHSSLGVKEQLPEPGSPVPGCSLALCSGFLEDKCQRDITQLVFNDVLSLDSPPPPWLWCHRIRLPACFYFYRFTSVFSYHKSVKSSVMSGSSKSLVLSAAAFERQRLYLAPPCTVWFLL